MGNNRDRLNWWEPAWYSHRQWVRAIRPHKIHRTLIRLWLIVTVVWFLFAVCADWWYPFLEINWFNLYCVYMGAHAAMIAFGYLVYWLIPRSIDVNAPYFTIVRGQSSVRYELDQIAPVVLTSVGPYLVLRFRSPRNGRRVSVAVADNVDLDRLIALLGDAVIVRDRTALTDTPTGRRRVVKPIS